ncbi:MAG: prepilin-type N-terminal cleavage/methylation domain-containing protein [bacterium]|nr:prepilin-type N-terminal cleavage/methylation domain-containing protein [bacterium]
MNTYMSRICLPLTPVNTGVSLRGKRGFTLIELLVVIAIIGLLSSVVLASLNSARAKTRDAKRISEIREIQKALELYYDDHGYYPFTSWVGSHQTAWETGALGTALEPYLPTMPVDPVNSSNISPGYAFNGNYNYSYYSAGYRAPGQTNQQWYQIVFRLEDTSNPIQNTGDVIKCNGQTSHYDESIGIVVLGGSCVQ